VRFDKAIIEFSSINEWPGSIEPELLKSAWKQLDKDTCLAGCGSLPIVHSFDLIPMLTILISFIDDLKSKNTNWDNLNYRVDLPANVDLSALETEAYCRLILYRSLQKIWFRKEYESIMNTRRLEP
jgi:hypothetical protein